MDLLDTQIFDRVGAEGISRLVAGFYSRVATDPLLRPLYPEEDLMAAEHRLRDFLIQRFGGPDDYSRRRGHPRLRMRHAPFPIDQSGRDRWVQLMEQSMEAADLPAEVIPPLRRFFHDAATFMINRDSPRDPDT